MNRRITIPLFLYVIFATAVHGQTPELYRSTANGSYTNCAIWEGMFNGEYEPLYNATTYNCTASLTSIQSTDLLIRHDITISSASFISVNKSITIEKGKLIFSNNLFLMARDLNIHVKKGAALEFRKGLTVDLGRVNIWVEPGGQVTLNDRLVINKKGVLDPSLALMPAVYVAGPITDLPAAIIEDGTFTFTSGAKNLRIGCSTPGKLAMSGNVQIGVSGSPDPNLLILDKVFANLTGQMTISGSAPQSAVRLEAVGQGGMELSGNLNILGRASFDFGTASRGLTVGGSLLLGRNINPSGSTPQNPDDWPVQYLLDWQSGTLSVKNHTRTYAYGMLLIGKGAPQPAPDGPAAQKPALLVGRDLQLNRQSHILVNGAASVFGNVALGYKDSGDAWPQYVFNTQLSADRPEGIPEVAIGGKGCQYWQGQDLLQACQQSRDFGVDLISFTAERAETGAALQWAAVGEDYNAYYSLERSADGVNYAAIAKIEPLGLDTDEVSLYRYFDANAPETVVYYRLQQVLFTGSKTELAAERLDPAGTEAMAWTVYPNPYSGGVLNIKTEQITSAAAVGITIRDAYGKIYYSRIYPGGNTGPYHLEIGDLPPMPKGVYLVLVEQGGKTVTVLLSVE